jgi:hypothetical protein
MIRIKKSVSSASADLSGALPPLKSPLRKVTRQTCSSRSLPLEEFCTDSFSIRHFKTCFRSGQYNSGGLAAEAGLHTTTSHLFPAFPAYSHLFPAIFRAKNKASLSFTTACSLVVPFPQKFIEPSKPQRDMTPNKNPNPLASAEMNDATTPFISPLTSATHTFDARLRVPCSLVLRHWTFWPGRQVPAPGCPSKKIFFTTHFLPTLYNPVLSPFCILHSKICIYSFRPP